MDAIVQTTKLEMILFASNSQWLPDRRPPVKMRLCGQTLHHDSHSHQPVALTLPAWTFQNTVCFKRAQNCSLPSGGVYSSGVPVELQTDCEREERMLKLEDYADVVLSHI